MSLLHVSVYDHHQEHVQSMAEVIFMLKHSVKLRRYMLLGDVAACHITK